jgi:hypothetical protein
MPGMGTFGRAGRVLMAAATFAGCVTVHKVRRPASPSDIGAINDAARKAPPLQVEYVQPVAPGDAAPTRIALLERADVAQVDAVGRRGERLTLDGARIKSVRVVDQQMGSLQGAGWGAAIGALLGVAVGASDHDNIIFSRAQGILFGGLIFGLVFGLVGAGIGGATGRQTVFVFDDAH